MIEKFSDAQADTLMDALGLVGDLVSSGDAPNDAIVKAAQARGLPAGHIPLMVHAYNTARTAQQQSLGETPLEKAADFPLAETATILERLYPTHVKTAAQQRHETEIADDYTQPPTWLPPRQSLQKLAQWAPRPPRTPTPFQQAKQAREAAYQEQLELSQLRRDTERARREVSACGDRLLASFDKLAEYFQRRGGVPFAEAQQNVQLLWGQPGAAIMARIEPRIPAQLKQAASRPQPVVTTQEPYRSVQACLQLGYELLERRDAYEKLAARLPPAADAPVARKSVLPKQADFGTVLGLQAAREMIGGIAGQLRGPNPDALIQKQLQSISSPDHEMSLRQLQTQAMLHDMVMNDPIISAHSPQAVANAYNEIAMQSPRAATQPLMMRAFLRKYLEQGQLDPFDADQLAGFEGKLKSNTTPEPTTLGTKGPSHAAVAAVA